MRVKYKVSYGCGHEFYSNSSVITQRCPKCGYPTCFVTTWDRELPEGGELLPVGLVFRARISKQADRLLIIIPKAIHRQVEWLLGREVEVEVRPA